VLLHGRDVTGLPPQSRGIGFVFQSYALFRHMSVAANVEFPLKVRRTPRAERRRRRDELLELVGLAGLGARLPGQLSGGQQQRVAIARALAHRPELLLLDEPFGALDARIRADLRRTIRAIQKELKVTAVFVTHDQEEAFELADRIGVMHFGRLLETGPPTELYLRPQTEFVATFLGTANLMIGEAAPEGVRLGPVRVPLATATIAGTAAPRRVQVLFRPEDVAVKTTPDALGWPLLGKATVEGNDFLGSFERLRLRLPRLDGVRPIAPLAPFGDDAVILEATRSQHQARRFPLRPGETAYVGVRRFHALAHPGLSFLLLTDGSDASRNAMLLAAQMARMSHARVSFLSYGMDGHEGEARLRALQEGIATGLASFEARAAAEPLPLAVGEETERRHFDLVIHAMPLRGADTLAERLLGAGDHSVLLIPLDADQGARASASAGKASSPDQGPPRVPVKAVIGVAVGEPAKEDILFAGRLIRHLGSEVTIMTVLPEQHFEAERRQAERFLQAGMRTLSLLGVTSRTVLRHGSVRDEVMAEMDEGNADLLVLGAPLPDERGRLNLHGVTGDLIAAASDRPILIVRSHPGEPWRA
ncbi:MAG TPA: ATP-binding cassette domain-containing protein, partial [Candidatus Polarisedimenticolia bacterium]|nr:ATP-binding cassette domain-containing protein [Candidatus Polarisedimenticolia bacterium]